MMFDLGFSADEIFPCYIPNPGSHNAAELPFVTERTVTPSEYDL